MQYIVLSNIQVQQVPNDAYKDRNLLLEFSFIHKYEAYSTWQDLTQILGIVLPKRVVIKGWKTSRSFVKENPDLYQKIRLGNQTGQNSNLGGFDSTPTFMRGDMIRFNVGYRGVVNGKQVTYMTGQDGIPDLFFGFISGVDPRLPFSLQCEDYMWLCKQIPTPAKQWETNNLQTIVSDILKEGKDLPLVKRYGDFYSNMVVSDFSKTDLKFNVRNFTTTRGSLAMLLSRLKTEYRVDSYFRGRELRIGYLHYTQEDDVNHEFTFQKNILDNDRLMWMRKDDAVLSMIVKSNYLRTSSGTTLDGATKTKHESTEILIYNNAGVFTYIKKEKGKDYPSKALDAIGERFTMNIFDAIDDPKKLFEIGKPQLEKYYYDGFRGSFSTFGIPYVKHGDTVKIVNPALPEQDGRYKVKAVSYYGGYDDGLRQEIFLDYKI